MAKLTVKDFTGEIRSDEEMLSVWQKVELDIANTGQAYNAGGGVEFTFADVDKVHAKVTFYEKRVLAKKGYGGRNYGDIAPSDNSNESGIT